MREEISEPQHWRSRRGANPSWSTSRRAATKPLPAELVDAAFGDEESLAAPRLDAAEAQGATEGNVTTYPDLIVCLTDQLTQLEAHRQQLQRLLAEASDSQS
jgi:hypothetical protein